MQKIDTEKIKNMTNDLVGYKNFERSEKMKHKRIKNLAFSFLILTLLIGGAYSVDALTDNSISNMVKDVLKIKVNDQDYNAKCDKTPDGKLKCKVDESVLKGGEFTLETDEKNKDNLNIEIKENDENIETDVTIKNVE